MPRTNFKKKPKKVNGWKVGQECLYEKAICVILEFPANTTVFVKQKYGNENYQVNFESIKPIKSKNKLKIGDYFKIKSGFVFQLVEKQKKGILIGKNNVKEIGQPSTCKVHISNVKKLKKK